MPLTVTCRACGAQLYSGPFVRFSKAIKRHMDEYGYDHICPNCHRVLDDRPSDIRVRASSE